MHMQNKVFKIVSNLRLPFLASYVTEDGFSSKTVVARLSCEACNTEIIANKTLAPICPCCASSIMQPVSEDTSILSNTDMSKYAHIADCKDCGSSYVTNTETLAQLKDNSFNCMICAEKLLADDMTTTDTPKSDGSSSNDDEKVTKSDMSKTDTSDSDNKDDTEADKELQEVLKKLGVNDDSDNKDDSAKDKSSDDKTTPVTSSDDDDSDDSDDDSEDDSDDDEDDSDVESSLSSCVLSSAIESAKKFSLVASEGFENWYMFADNSPVAVAEFSKADASIQRIFRSNEYVAAFNQAVKSDGGVNNTLITDFGFTPVDVKVDLDTVTKQTIKEKVSAAVKDFEEKTASLAEYYDQCIGISSAGIIKGFYGQGDGFRNALIAKLETLNVREPDVLVDEILAQELPSLLKSVLTLSKSLMDKSSDSLETLASTIRDASPRATTPKPSNKDKGKVLPFAVFASTENSSDEAVTSKAKDNRQSIGDKLLSNINRRF